MPFAHFRPFATKKWRKQAKNRNSKINDSFSRKYLIIRREHIGFSLQIRSPQLSVLFFFFTKGKSIEHFW